MKQPTDTLTGLISGVELQSDIDALIEKEQEFSFLMLDIDSLMRINTEFGNAVGDEVFLLIADKIRALFAEPCRSYRDTRDQFDVLLPGYTKEEAFLLAETLRKAVCETDLGHKDLNQTISIGISSYPDDGNRTAEIIRMADGALIRAKKTGRNRVCLAREEKMVPKTSHYTLFQLEKLTETAKRMSVGEAVLLREALDDLIRKYDV